MDPVGGVIVRQADGKTPSGILRDNAMGLVDRVIPPPSRRRGRRGLAGEALAEARSLGVTTLQDMDGGAPLARRFVLRALQKLARSGELTARVDERRPIESAKELTEQGIQVGFGDSWLTLGGVKGFMDGSLGSNTAKMFEPFFNRAEQHGRIFVTSAEFPQCSS